MGGVDTFRGCSFQAAYSVGLALDVLGGAASALVLEGSTDVVDAALESAVGEVLSITQAKTKVEPYVWSPKQVADVIVSWLDQASVAGADFEFVTDGTFGPGVIGELAPAFARLRDGIGTTHDTTYLESLGIDSEHASARRVVLRSRLPEGRVQLEQATLRVMALRERSSPVSTDEARDLVWRLFGETVFGAGESDASKRRLSRDDIGLLVGVAPSCIDAAEPWSGDLEEAYKVSLTRMPPNPEWAALEMLRVEAPAVLSLVVGQESGTTTRPEPAVALLERRDDAVLVGPAGAGKTTTLRLLQTSAVERGLLPISVRVASYLPGTLERLVQRRLEQCLGQSLSPATVNRLFAREDVVLLIDGAGELVHGQRAAFAEDLGLMRAKHYGVHVILAAREAFVVRGAPLKAYGLQPLDGPMRRGIAARLDPDLSELVTDLENRLGGLVQSPLLFMMALGLAARGIRPKSRAELFEAFTTGLQSRDEGRRLSRAARAAVESCCFELRSTGRYGADGWWWIDHIRRESEIAGSAGLQTSGASAEDVLESLQAAGLIWAAGESSELVLLHDLFCDWLASEAVVRRARSLPEAVPESLEDVVVFLAEADQLDHRQQKAVVANPVAAVTVADHMPAGAPDPARVQEIWEILLEQLGPAVRAPLLRRRVCLGEGGDALVWLGAESPSGASSLVEESPVTCLALDPVSSLSVAVDLWIAVIRLKLGAESHERPSLIGSTPLELVRGIGVAVERRERELRRLVMEIVPGLLPRVQQIVGPSGIRGQISPAVSTRGFPGPGDVYTHHPLSFNRIGDTVDIEIVRSDGPGSSAFQTLTSAEDFLRHSPTEYATNAVTDAITKLMPRFDD
jgi:hypothetical protein